MKNDAAKYIAHYERLLAGSLSSEQRRHAEAELAYWQQIQERGAEPFRPDPLACYAAMLYGGTYRKPRTI